MFQFPTTVEKTQILVANLKDKRENGLYRGTNFNLKKELSKESSVA